MTESINLHSNLKFLHQALYRLMNTLVSGFIKGDQCSIVLALQTGGFDAVRVEKPVLEINNTRGKTYIKIN